MRTFTLPEAQTLIPVLDALLQRAQAAASIASAREHSLQSLHQSIFLAGGMRVDLLRVATLKGEHDKAVEEARSTLGEIDEIGVDVKDLHTGLLEFPFQLEDDVVLLLWTQGDPSITAWRTADQSYDDRQPLDDRFLPGSDNRPH